MREQEFQQLFLDSLQSPFADLLGLRKQAEISYYMDLNPVQDSFRYRAKDLGLKIAALIIDEKGELDQKQLIELNGYFERFPFVLGPHRENDAMIYAHIGRCLKGLIEKKEIWNTIRKFSPPLCHKKAEEIIRETLWPEPIRTVQTVHIRKAVIASWLTLLRQTTGSCFATAPAILIQRNHPLLFLKDLYNLLSMGQLKRTVGGKQYTVPLSLSSGVGDLQRPASGFSALPGIWAALQAVDVKMSGKFHEKIDFQEVKTVEKYLRVLLLEALGLNEEDVREEENLARIQMTLLMARQGAVYFQKPSDRAQKVAEWKKKFAKACTTFKVVTECALLRSWEYTIASLCDVKTEFSRWNLYVGLGIHPDQREGIGSFLYEHINEHLQRCNQKIDRLSKEYETEIGAAQALEAMIRNASSDARLNQLKAEMMSHSLSANTILDLRNQSVAKSQALVDFFPSVLEQYDQKIQEYFQELFDPALLGEGEVYDDSPAGFRLVYKHGRTDASQWTAIENQSMYIECLREFFSNIENDLVVNPELGRDFISNMTTAVIQYIQTPEFIASALKRSQENGRRTPWDYISGGTLQSLLMTYSNRDKPFTEKIIVPNKEEQLFQFLKQMKQRDPMLMHSPTHAFIFYSELMQLSHPSQRPLRKWNEEMQEYLAHAVSSRLPEEEKALFIHLYRQKQTAQTNAAFRSVLIDSCPARIKNREAIVDSILYEQTPLFSQMEAKDALQSVVKSLGIKKDFILNSSFYGAYDLYTILKMTILRSERTPFSSTDWDMKIHEAMRRIGCSSPLLSLFADTNWSGWFFGFVSNPATNHIELWRLNRSGTRGFPMSEWKEWLSSKNASAWILLGEPREYFE